MINANEVRLGNFVGPENAPLFVTEIHGSTGGELPSAHAFRPDRGLVNVNALDPIPLTPEILEKCGFDVRESAAKVKMARLKIAGTNTVHLRLYENEFAITIDSITGSGIWALGIHYLHQLQNLYFALTGQELEVKL